MLTKHRAVAYLFGGLLALVVLSACGDRNPTAPGAKELFIVSVSSRGVREVYVSVGNETWLDIQSNVVGRSALESADHLTVKIDSLLTMTRMSDVSYVSVTYVDGVEMPMVTHFESLKLKAGSRTGATWLRYQSQLDPSKRDSLRIIVLPLGE